ncbi:MAG: undecaprenyl-diphosphate phosphatase [bacterium]
MAAPQSAGLPCFTGITMRFRSSLVSCGVAAALFCIAAAAARTSAAESTTNTPARNSISIAQAAIFGVVEGLTEYLPVSSTGHLILTGHWMGLSQLSGERGPLGPKIEKDQALDAFEIVIQLGAILAVLGLYRRRVRQMCLGLAGRSKDGLRLTGLLIVAFLPAAICGLLLRKPIKEFLFNPLAVAIALFAGGVAMIVIERIIRKRGPAPVQSVDNMVMKHALIIGLAQCIAMWPGVSRSMITIVAGLVVGLDILAAAEFSFLLALPTLGAATLYEGFKSWDVLMSSAGPASLAIGLVVSGIVAAIAVKGLVKWLTGHGLLSFGIYRILLALAVLLLL